MLRQGIEIVASDDEANEARWYGKKWREVDGGLLLRSTNSINQRLQGLDTRNRNIQ